jgi:hypothetical protein
MSKVELETLEQLGRSWHEKVWLTADSKEAAREVLGQVNETLQAFRPSTFKVYTVFHAHDPYVRTAGLRSGSYFAIVEWAANQPDGGIAAAAEILDCLDTKELKDISLPMAALLVIACFAEVGRGYAGDLHRFFSWMQSIKNSSKASTAIVKWRSVNEAFPASLTYKADQADFVPDF